jgi:hypothetical protein
MFCRVVYLDVELENRTYSSLAVACTLVDLLWPRAVLVFLDFLVFERS